MPALRRYILIVLTLLGVFGCTEQRPLSPATGDTVLIHEPWPDEEAENLAWLISGSIYAPQDLYDRIRADLATIREDWGDSIAHLRSIRHVPWSQPQIWLTLDTAVRGEMFRGEYHDWDSLNLLFGAQVNLSHAFAPFISSANRANIWRMLQSYELLRGVRAAWPNARMGDRPNIYAFLHRWGIAYLYRRAQGDCEVGCLWSRVHYFRSRSDGIEYVGYWDVDPDSDTPPIWWYEARRCWLLYDNGDAAYRSRDTSP